MEEAIKNILTVIFVFAGVLFAYTTVFALLLWRDVSKNQKRLDRLEKEREIEQAVEARSEKHPEGEK